MRSPHAHSFRIAGIVRIAVTLLVAGVMLMSISVRSEKALSYSFDQPSSDPSAALPTLTVNKLADTNDGVCDTDCSLREAIAVAAPGDTISFSLNGDIGLSLGELVINKNLTIQGPTNPAQLRLIRSSGSFRIISITGAFTVTISGVTISGGTVAAGNSGGGISNAGGNLTLTNVAVFTNNAPTGGGIFNSGTLTVVNSTIAGNTSASHGGGILNESGMTNLTSSTVRNNTSGGNGGGIASLAGSTTLNVVKSTISGNNAQGSAGPQGGGGIYHRDGPVNLTSSTIANNSVQTVGGGVHMDNNGTSPVLTSRNSIIGQNTAPASADCAGTFNSEGYNLIGDTTGTTVVGGSNDILNVAPMLGALTINGGPTFTQMPLSGSPVIDKGNSFGSATDQRGQPRPADFPGVPNAPGGDGSDIGAAELGRKTVSKLTDSNDGACDADCSLREAVATALSSDIIDFGITGTVTLSLGEIVIGKDLVIQGPGAAMVSVSGNNASRVFLINTGFTVSISGITVTGGTVTASPGGAGIRNNGGTLNLTDVAVSGNSAASGSMTNRTGGGVLNSGTLNVSNSTFSNNTASNTAAIAGGGIHSTGTLTVANSTFSNNTAYSSAGGGVAVANGTATVTNSVFTSNVSNSSIGGAISNNGNITVTGSTFSANTAVMGAGISNQGTTNVAGSTFTGNSGAYGVLRTNGAALNINDCIISGNTATVGSGAITGGSFTLTNSTVSGNTAAGGAITVGNSTIVNSTISGNTSTGSNSGGGIYLNDGGGGVTLTLINTTVSSNTANSSGSTGGIAALNGTVISRNSIIAGNTGPTPDFGGTLTSQGYNLIGNTTGTTIVGGSNDILNTNPMLGPLANNGGTTMTHALLPGSPAIDKGSAASPPLTTDQRGSARPYDNPSVANAPGGDGSDIGAFERQPTDPGTVRAPFDFDGDGKTDIGIFRPVPAEWWITRSSDAAVFATQFGSTTDRIVPGDYTGDGKADIAIWRPSTGFWYVLRSEDFSFFAFPFGANGDIPVPADYDGDGKIDAAVFRSSTATWYIRRSSDGGTTIVQFGAPGDTPVVGDYDGDGRADIAIFRSSPGQWWINRSTAGVIAMSFGNSTDRPVQGDYTGDGKTDVAFWRPTTGDWYILRSEDFSFYAFPFGANGDVPAPGDYDGDGKHDATVFRDSNATWYVSQSTGGTLIRQFGAAGDRPLPNAFVP